MQDNPKKIKLYRRAVGQRRVLVALLLGLVVGAAFTCGFLALPRQHALTKPEWCARVTYKQAGGCRLPIAATVTETGRPLAMTWTAQCPGLCLGFYGAIRDGEPAANTLLDLLFWSVLAGGVIFTLMRWADRSKRL